MKYIILFIIVAFLFTSCEKAEQRKFARLGKNWNISVEYNLPDSFPKLEFESTAKFNKRNSTVTIGDTLTMYYKYYEEERTLIFADTIQVMIYNKKAWVVRWFHGNFNEDFDKIGGFWKYRFNSDSIYFNEKPANYEGWTYEISYWYLNKI